MKVLTIIVSILIIIAVLIPGSNIPEVDMVGVDKFVHIAMFSAWAIAVRYDFPRIKPWIVFIFGVGFSLFTEILQLFIEGRSFDLYDMIADGAGLLLGLLLTPVATKILNQIFTSRS
ncbi:MAG TPA: VanZ family protein [Chryseosolibacter sp.]